jgi:hypothetical protein
MDAAKLPQMLTVDEFADLARLPARRVKALCLKGEIEAAVLPGDHILIPRDVAVSLLTPSKHRRAPYPPMRLANASAEVASA